MRTYKILKEKAIAFDSDPEVRQLIAEIHDPEIDPLINKYSRDHVEKLRALNLDADLLGTTGLGWERLDQLVIEHLLGSR